MITRVSLEHWKMFIAVVEAGGFVQAAEQLHKTQSTISHGIKKIEALLNQSLFTIEGRKSELTPFGHLLLPKVKLLLGEAESIERLSGLFHENSIGEINIAIDTLYPKSRLYSAIDHISRIYPYLSTRIYETTLSRTTELLEDGKVHIGIAWQVPQDHIAEPCMNVNMIAVASPLHPLSQTFDLSVEQLKSFRQIVLMDQGIRSNQNTGWLGSENRISIGSVSSAIDLVCQNLGYAWLPEHEVQELITQKKMIALPLKQNANRPVLLQLATPNNLTDRPEIKLLSKLLCHDANLHSQLLPAQNSPDDY